MKKREIIEKNLEAIETYIPGLPGTSLTRVLMDVNLCRKYSIKVPKKMVLKQREAVMVWCVGVGTLNMPKNFYYGFTPSGAVQVALKALKDLVRTDRVRAHKIMDIEFCHKDNVR